jgi:hypothetical protein
MRTKLVLWSLCLALAAGAAWHWRGTTFSAKLLPPAPPPVVARPLDLPPQFGNDVGIGAGVKAAAQTATGVRKCVVDGRVLYTDGDCPTGSRERALGGGSMNVLQGQPAGAQPIASSQPAAVRNIREILVGPTDTSLQDKRMDAIIGR